MRGSIDMLPDRSRATFWAANCRLCRLAAARFWIRELGAVFRPFDETLRDSVAWQRADGC